MSEGVDLPPHPRQGFLAELVPYESVPEMCLIHHADVVGRRFIVHDPAVGMRIGFVGGKVMS